MERDLLKDLWEYSYDVYDEGAHDSLTGRAAAEITQLRAELAEANGRIDLRDGECQVKSDIIACLELEFSEALHSEGAYRRKNHALTEELAAERELSDRLVKQLSAWVDLASCYEALIGAVEEEDEKALSEWRTRRNK